MSAERKVVILKYVRKVPSLASCSLCQSKFFTPTSYYHNPIEAERYLQDKLDLNRCTIESATIRCPYCAQGGHFKAMIGREGGFECARCSHRTMLEVPDYRCACRNSLFLDAVFFGRRPM